MSFCFSEAIYQLQSQQRRRRHDDKGRICCIDCIRYSECLGCIFSSGKKHQVNSFYCHLNVSHLLLVHIDQPVPLSIQSSTLLFSKAQISFSSYYLFYNLGYFERNLAAFSSMFSHQQTFAEFSLWGFPQMDHCFCP